MDEIGDKNLTLTPGRARLDSAGQDAGRLA